MNIAIVGTGYVGLVSGACFAEIGANVTCIDVDEKKIARLVEGEIPIYEPGLDELVKKNVKAGRLKFTTSLAKVLNEQEVVFSAVGTPPDEDGSADLRYVLQVAKTIGENLDKPIVVVTKSTVPVGTALKVRKTIQAELDKRGKDIKFDVASNPALTWLDLARNQVPSLDLSSNTALQYFNCSNSEETLDDQSLAANNHNGGEADNVKPTTGSSKASNGGNSLSDLVFYSNIADVRANYNDLHCITTGANNAGSFANLTRIEYAHNHINGINLATAASNNPTIVDEDNGRAITAECAKFIKHGTAEEVTVYYFQLENIKGQQLTGKTSIDSKNATRYLGEDGFELAKISEWDGTNAAPYIPATTGISPKDVTIDPSNMADYLGADVEGTVVVLKEDAQHPGEGRATYSYNNGVGNSTFYLDWEANADLPTAINVIEVGDGLSIAGSYGGLTINGADGTVVGVYDMSGRQVASETISDGTATITGLTPGIYVVNGHKVVVK